MQKYYYWAAGLTVPVAFIVKLATGRRRKKPGDRTARGDNEFICERVCTSDRLLRRMGSLAKEPTAGSCVTVCGVSATDACTDACGRSVCTNVHQVPAWNEKCLQRCANECLRGKAAYS